MRHNLQAALHRIACVHKLQMLMGWLAKRRTQLHQSLIQPILHHLSSYEGCAPLLTPKVLHKFWMMPRVNESVGRQDRTEKKHATLLELPVLPVGWKDARGTVQVPSILNIPEIALGGEDISLPGAIIRAADTTLREDGYSGREDEDVQ